MNAIITGASSGIGRAIAEIFAQMNINLFLIGRSDERLREVASKTSSFDIQSFYTICNVSNPKECAASYKLALKKLGKINILVTSAGVGTFKLVEDHTDDEYEAMFNTNVRGVFNWLRLIIPDMKRNNSGQIIIISSTGGLQAYPRGGLYCASKFAVQAMSETLRKELKNTRIKVATINPGSVDSPWFDDRLSANDKRRETMLTTQDVAKAAKMIIEQDDTSNIDKIVLEY